MDATFDYKYSPGTLSSVDDPDLHALFSQFLSQYEQPAIATAYQKPTKRATRPVGGAVRGDGGESRNVKQMHTTAALKEMRSSVARRRGPESVAEPMDLQIGSRDRKPELPPQPYVAEVSNSVTRTQHEEKPKRKVSPLMQQLFREPKEESTASEDNNQGGDLDEEDISSDDGPGKDRQKAHHKRVEQTRRKTMNQAIDDLRARVPNCLEKDNKTVVLQRSVVYMKEALLKVQELRTTNARLQEEHEALRKLSQKLGKPKEEHFEVPSPPAGVPTDLNLSPSLSVLGKRTRDDFSDPSAPVSPSPGADDESVVPEPESKRARMVAPPASVKGLESMIEGVFRGHQQVPPYRTASFYVLIFFVGLSVMHSPTVVLQERAVGTGRVLSETPDMTPRSWLSWIANVGICLSLLWTLVLRFGPVKMNVDATEKALTKLRNAENGLLAGQGPSEHLAREVLTYRGHTTTSPILTLTTFYLLFLEVVCFFTRFDQIFSRLAMFKNMSDRITNTAAAYLHLFLASFNTAGFVHSTLYLLRAQAVLRFHRNPPPSLAAAIRDASRLFCANNRYLSPLAVMFESDTLTKEESKAVAMNNLALYCSHMASGRAAEARIALNEGLSLIVSSPLADQIEYAQAVALYMDLHNGVHSDAYTMSLMLYERGLEINDPAITLAGVVGCGSALLQLGRFTDALRILDNCPSMDDLASPRQNLLVASVNTIRGHARAAVGELMRASCVLEDAAAMLLSSSGSFLPAVRTASLLLEGYYYVLIDTRGISNKNAPLIALLDQVQERCKAVLSRLHDVARDHEQVLPRVALLQGAYKICSGATEGARMRDVVDELHPTDRGDCALAQRLIAQLDS